MIKVISIIGFLLLSTGCTTLDQSAREQAIDDDPQTIPLLIWEF